MAADNEIILREGLDLNSTSTVFAVPVQAYQKATVHLHNLTGAAGSLVLTVYRSVAEGFLNSASATTLSAAGMTSVLDVQGYRWIYIAVSTAAGSTLTGSVTVHIEATV